MNNYYSATGYPAYDANGDSASARAEFASIQAGFDKLPALGGNSLYLVRVNAAATGLEAVTASTAKLLASDGSVPAAANIPMGGFKFTGLGAATANGDSVRYEQVGALAIAQAHAATSKTTPVDADELPLYDSVSTTLQKLTLTNLFSNYIKSAIWAAWGALIGAGTAKNPPVGGDSLAIMDSAAGNATKTLSLTNLVAYLNGVITVSSATSLTGIGNAAAFDARYAPISAKPTIEGYVNLVGSSAGSVKTASWTADQLVAYTALNGTPYIGSSLSLSFNGTGTGAGGMDTGAVPTSGSLYVYAIYNPTTATWSALGTTAGSGASVYGGANMPAGYTASCLIWAGVTDASANVQKFSQYGRDIDMPEHAILSAAAGVTALTAQSVSAAVPANAKRVRGNLSLSASVARSMAIASDASGTSICVLGAAAVNNLNSSYGNAHFDIPLITAQTVYWNAWDTSAYYNMRVHGYQI